MNFSGQTCRFSSFVWLPGAYLAYAVYLAFTGGENLLGPDPAQFLSLETGEWAIRLLILSLAITPLTIPA